LSPQTTPQILRCLVLGRYTARVVDGKLRVEGPQPLAGPLPASIKARRDELVAYLNAHCGGTWPPAPGSEIDTLPTPPRKSRDARVHEWLQKPREERAREFRQKLHESRKPREGVT
jgi:hypothetical protein